MSTHPLVLLVEPNPLLRELLHGELKEQGCIVVDTDSSEEALAFAQLYPGAIDLAVTDLPCQADEDQAFVTMLRSLPTGSRAKVLRVEGEFDRDSLVCAVRHMSPSRDVERVEPHSRNKAVFWGSTRDTTPPAAVQ